MKKRALFVLITLIVTISLSVSAFADGFVASLKKMTAGASETQVTIKGGDTLTSGEYKLTGNYAIAGTDCVTIPNDAEVTLDLCGYTLDCSQQTDCTFKCLGKLTLKDSVGTGVIFGGYNFDTDTVSEESRQNRFIYVCGMDYDTDTPLQNRAVFTMDGGTVKGFYAFDGSAIYTDYADFTMNGGKITKNRGENAGAVAIAGSDTNCRFSGGEITENYGAFNGGVMIYGTDAGAPNVTFGGSCKITSNTSLKVYKDRHGNLATYDGNQITANNVCIEDAKYIKISVDNPNADMKVGITISKLSEQTEPFSNDLSDLVYKKYFISDDDTYVVSFKDRALYLQPVNTSSAFSNVTTFTLVLVGLAVVLATAVLLKYIQKRKRVK